MQTKPQQDNKTHPKVAGKTNSKQQINFYREFCMLFLTNKILVTQLNELEAEKLILLQRLDRIERGDEEDYPESSHEDKKKRMRRTASQIQRHYQCKVKSCCKSYGSQGSLNQHMKFKHPQLFQEFLRSQMPEVKQEYHYADKQQ